MNSPRIALLTLSLPLALALAAPAQDSPLLSRDETAETFTRAIQLVESTMLTVPGLARAGEPLLESCKQGKINLMAAGSRHAGRTYALLVNLRAYLALADSLPKPYPFPAEAAKQFAELRASVDRIESHFGGLLVQLHQALANSDRDELRRYADDNLKVGPPQPNQPRVVFFGDSITDGWRLNEYFPDSDFINRGISGQITGEMLGRMKADVIDLEPKAVVILAGTNDIARGVAPSTIQNNLTMMAELAGVHKIKVIIASLLPVHDYNKNQNPLWERSVARPPAVILAMNDWIRAYCRQNRHEYLDYFSEMVDENGALRKELSTDGLHPNGDGYRVMSPLVWSAIVKKVPQPAGPRRR